MAQLIIEVLQAKRERDVIHLELMAGGRRIIRDVTASKVDTPEKLALWVLRQAAARGTLEEGLRRRLVVDYHLEEVEGEEGQQTSIPVVDGVVASRLTEEQAILDIEALPGWSTFTGDEAVVWINANVTDPNVRVPLRAMARMLVAQRNVIGKLVERIQE